jgi:hypothetical protein
MKTELAETPTERADTTMLGWGAITGRRRSTSTQKCNCGCGRRGQCGTSCSSCNCQGCAPSPTPPPTPSPTPPPTPPPTPKVACHGDSDCKDGEQCFAPGKDGYRCKSNPCTPTCVKQEAVCQYISGSMPRREAWTWYPSCENRCNRANAYKDNAQDYCSSRFCGCNAFAGSFPSTDTTGCTNLDGKGSSGIKGTIPTAFRGRVGGASEVCCPTSCGTCGGANCASRPGGGGSCCVGSGLYKICLILNICL